MGQLDDTPRTLPGLDMTLTAYESRLSGQPDKATGGAWLSTARVVRCWVKSRNERNPHRMLPADNAGDSSGTAGVIRRKEGMTSNQHAPYALGCTHATMASTKGCKAARPSQSPKTRLSSDWSLQLDSMKLESLVTVDQQRRGEYVPGPCTHRPSSHGSWQHPKSAAAAQGEVSDWD